MDVCMDIDNTKREGKIKGNIYFYYLLYDTNKQHIEKARGEL